MFRLLPDSNAAEDADAEDADLGEVHDRCGNQPADPADGRDREGAALQVFDPRLARPAVRAQTVDLGRDPGDVPLVHVLDHRHDEQVHQYP